MKKFRKKPVVVEAMQWTGDNTGAVMEWVGEHLDPATGERVLSFVPLAYPAPKLWSASLEQWHLVRQGDWFIRGLTGFYPLEPNTFAATYEPADKPVRDEAAELRAENERLRADLFEYVLDGFVQGAHRQEDGGYNTGGISTYRDLGNWLVEHAHWTRRPGGRGRNQVYDPPTADAAPEGQP